MDREEIIRLARETGFDQTGLASFEEFTARIERFAALVAVQVEATWQNRYLKLVDLMQIREGQPNKPCCLAEREACAKVCEEEIKRVKPIYSVTAENCVKAIRARGQE
jgi:hypothetical protein